MNRKTTKINKVLHIITDLSRGGAEAVLVRLIEILRDDCQHAVVSLSDKGVYGDVLQGLGAEIITLDMPRGRLTWNGIWRLLGVIRSFYPSVVQTWMYHADLLGGLVARLAGCRAVVWGIHASTLDPIHTSLVTRWVVRACAVLSRIIPAAIITCSERGRDAHRALGYQADKFVVIPNGINLNHFRPDHTSRRDIRSELAVADNVPLIGMVARWDPYKDHATFFNAASKVTAIHPDVRFVLCGPGMILGNSELTRLIDSAKLNEHVTLIGERADIHRIMNALDLHVLSSLSEAFPNVVAEAMACGVPCLVTDVGDGALIVGQSGWVVPPQRSDLLATAMIEAITLPNPVRLAKAQDARTRVIEHFSIEEMANRYYALWEQVA